MSNKSEQNMRLQTLIHRRIFLLQQYSAKMWKRYSTCCLQSDRTTQCSWFSAVHIWHAVYVQCCRFRPNNVTDNNMASAVTALLAGLVNESRMILCNCRPKEMCSQGW